MDVNKDRIEILDLDRREEILIMELQDVLTDISTPDTSDIEGDEVDEPLMPQVRDALLGAQARPRYWITYLRLYESS